MAGSCKRSSSFSEQSTLRVAGLEMQAQAVKEQLALAEQFQAKIQKQLKAEIKYNPQQFNQRLLQVGRQAFDIQQALTVLGC